MKTRIIRLVAIILVMLMGAISGQVLGYDAIEEVTQRERFLSEHEYAIKETYLARQAGEYGSKQQLLRLIRDYNNCFYGDICK